MGRTRVRLAISERVLVSLVFFSLPDVARALSPAVRTGFVDAVPAFYSVKQSALAHKQNLSPFICRCLFIKPWIRILLHWRRLPHFPFFSRPHTSFCRGCFHDRHLTRRYNTERLLYVKIDGPLAHIFTHSGSMRLCKHFVETDADPDKAEKLILIELTSRSHKSPGRTHYS